MELEYIIADPTGNITLLVTTPVARERQPRAAAALMELEPKVEQTGFLTLTGSGAQLRMAGGEFCGNAAMSAGAVSARERGLSAGEKIALPVSVSGAALPVRTELEALADGSFAGTVDMPAPVWAGEEPFELDGVRCTLPLVRFPGIAHVIVTADMAGPAAERAARKWCARLDVPALGLMLFDERRSALRPLVYVPGADTLFWESSCASGTAAVGAWLSLRDGARRSLTLSEPAGELSIEAELSGGRPLLRLGGRVSLGGRKRGKVLEN